MLKENWAVLAIYKEQRQIKKGMVEAEADAFLVEMKKKFEGRDVKLYKISHTLTFPPDPEKVQQPGTLWCPYCRDYRKFKADRWGVDRCVICEISTEDFHVVRYNHLKR